MLRLLFLLLSLSMVLQAEEEKFLSHIRQLTFPSMAFEKAGEAYFSPDEKSIIFQAVPIGQEEYQMFVMNLEEGIPVMCSTGFGACTCGFFHPKGEKVIFASSHEDRNAQAVEPSKPGKYKWNLTPYMNIYEAALDGSFLRPLTSGPAYHAECAYSPDGSLIVYASNEEGSMNLYVMNADGSKVRQLTYTTHCYNGGPFFSPDGKKIVFRSDREVPDHLQIYEINVDGSDEKQITFNNAVNWAPYWHPNGKMIAYTTSLHGHHQYEIYLLDMMTGVHTRLTNKSSFNGLPVFNRDGTKIMWTSKRGENRSCQIFIADFKLPAGAI